MNYDGFRGLWQETLRQARFPWTGPEPSEKIDLRSMDRHYRAFLWWPDRRNQKVFSISAEIAWRWDALLSARFATTEEDMLMQLDMEGGYHKDSDPPLLRIDVTLHASVPRDCPLRMPSVERWQCWMKEVSSALDPILPIKSGEEEFLLPVLSYHGEPEVMFTFDPQGLQYLRGMSYPAWQFIRLPRQWDDPDKADD